MVLSTATPEALPSQRVVILREYGQAGLIFVSSSTSWKGVKLHDRLRFDLINGEWTSAPLQP